MKDILVIKGDKLAHQVYKATKKFPKNEQYGITSQLRRSAISIVLNSIEGFARNRSSEYLHFLEIAYGSLKETKYLLHFSWKEEFISVNEYKNLISISEEIGKILWERLKRIRMKNSIKKII